MYAHHHIYSNDNWQEKQRQSLQGYQIDAALNKNDKMHLTLLSFQKFIQCQSATGPCRRRLQAAKTRSLVL